MPAAPYGVTVHVLADYPQLIAPVGQMRWQEWRADPGREEPVWWIETTAREAGRTRLPVTWVAIGAAGEALGAVGLAEYDLEERRDRSPWLVGMIVREDLRALGIGVRLVTELEAWAANRGYQQLWVATGDPAVGFYQKCGWTPRERLMRGGEATHVLTRQL